MVDLSSSLCKRLPGRVSHDIILRSHLDRKGQEPWWEQWRGAGAKGVFPKPMEFLEFLQSQPPEHVGKPAGSGFKVGEWLMIPSIWC